MYARSHVYISNFFMYNIIREAALFMDIKEAVDFINNYRRHPSDPVLLQIQTCASCGEDFPSLSSDVTLRKEKNIDPKCKLCFRDERRIKLRNSQRKRRKEVKDQKDEHST
jgi:hypothetical protein